MLNTNEKNAPMQETKDLAPFELERRLMEEINILRLEGSLFCFDPRAAKKRSGTLTLADARKKPVSLRIDANYGQPSVLAYKVLQGIFLKLTEEGCDLSEDGRCLYSDTVSFSARELAMLAGRSWSGRTSEQLHQAIMQLRRTGVVASLYEKETDQWAVADFEVLISAYFAGRGETISRCAVQLHPKIVASLNRRHVAFFNLHRLSTLDTLGLVLYKRVFFHLSNLMHEHARQSALHFTKDYGAICSEWLGGLKPLRYKAHILKDQLGRHLEALKATGLIRRYDAREERRRGRLQPVALSGEGVLRGLPSTTTSTGSSRASGSGRSPSSTRSRRSSWWPTSIGSSAASSAPASRITRPPMPTSSSPPTPRQRCAT